MYIYKSKSKSGKHKYYFIFKDHLGIRRKFAGFSDLNATRALAGNIERLINFKVSGCVFDVLCASFIETLSERLRARLTAIGLLDLAYSVKAKPLMVAKKMKPKRSSHYIHEVSGGILAEYKKHIEAKGLSLNHIKVTIQNCSNVIVSEKWAHISDITSKSVNCYISRANELGLSIRKINSNIISLKGFCTWMTRQGYMAENPMKGIHKLKLNSDMKVKRRALSEGEINSLLEATVCSEVHHGLTGEERSLVYRIALTTGLRYNEIKTLSRSDFDLDMGIVTVRAKNAKNSKTVILPLKKAELTALRGYFTRNPALPHVQAFNGMQAGAGAKMLKVDLTEAGVAYENDYGKADFHSLRHTFCTMLAKSGVQPQVAQRLMRHSSIDLTMNYYTHILIEDKASAIGMLPEFGVSKVVRNGTDNIANIIPENEGYNKGDYSGKNCSKMAKIGDFEGRVNKGDCVKEKAVNSLDSKELTASSLGTRSRIRTVDLLIKSQLL